jgi:hypothetical protein
LDVGDAPPPSGGKGAREVSTEEGERYASAKGCLFLGEFPSPGWDDRLCTKRARSLIEGIGSVETSAKTNTGVMEAFSDLVIRVSTLLPLFLASSHLRPRLHRSTRLNLLLDLVDHRDPVIMVQRSYPADADEQGQCPVGGR